MNYRKQVEPLEIDPTISSRLIHNLEKVIVGKHSVLELIVAGLFCQGHILIEDVPGTGKTILARSLARSLGCSFSRLQFTPDMLPSDVTGVSIFDQSTRQFEFKPGPVFHQIVLVDEINRSTPKTQAALLEAMEERQVSVDGQTHPLPRPFMVIATQNPIEYEGTFPLPEAQLDRFLIRVKLGYPDMQNEMGIISAQKVAHPINTLTAVISADELQEQMESVKQVFVSDLIMKYILDLVTSTRNSSDFYLGASPRGSLALYKVGQALAFMRGRDFVLPDDIKAIAGPVLAHRVIISAESRIKEVNPNKVIEELLTEIPVPGGELNEFKQR